MEWTGRQMLAVALARQIEDGKTYIVGTGLPLVGAALAKNTHAPNAHLIFETGYIEGFPLEIPTGVSDIRLNHDAAVAWPMYRYFGLETILANRGQIAAGFLGGAQIDPYGNLNSTSIGDYYNPQTRFSGSGGANGIATYCDVIITMKHEKRRFVDHVDYNTSPGWIDGPDGRAKKGLPADRGPRAVVTELGIMRFDDDTKRMYLSEYFANTTPEFIKENTGFELDITRANLCPPPTDEILEILTKKIDPKRLMI